MKKKVSIILTYLTIVFNTNLLCEEENKILKIGLIAPLTGELAELGNFFIFFAIKNGRNSDKNVFIVPRDSGHTIKKSLIMQLKI